MSKINDHIYIQFHSISFLIQTHIFVIQKRQQSTSNSDPQEKMIHKRQQSTKDNDPQEKMIHKRQQSTRENDIQAINKPARYASTRAGRG